MSHLVLVACFTFESLTADIFVAEEDEDDQDELDHDDIAEADEHEQEVGAAAGQEVGAGAGRLEPRSEDLAVETNLDSDRNHSCYCHWCHFGFSPLDTQSCPWPPIAYTVRGKL